jgi:hypothetical protein
LYGQDLLGETGLNALTFSRAGVRLNHRACRAELVEEPLLLAPYRSCRQKPILRFLCGCRPGFGVQLGQFPPQGVQVGFQRVGGTLNNCPRGMLHGLLLPGLLDLDFLFLHLLPQMSELDGRFSRRLALILGHGGDPPASILAVLTLGL